MLGRFTKKPFTDRLKDTGFLLKNSFSVIGKDSDIIKPTIRMIIFSLIITTLFFVSLLSFFIGHYIGLGILILLITTFILTPFKFFYYIRQKADQSWIVYNTITGKDISYRDAHNHTKSEKSSLRKIAFVDLLMKYATNRRSNQGGFTAFLVNLFLAALREVWDLLSHYMIPGVVIEQKPLMQIIPQIKSLRKNVPATLVGVFGIDFVGNVIGRVLFPIYFVVFSVGVGAGYLLVSVLPNTVWTFGNYSVSWVPILIAAYIISIIGGIVRKLVESTKVIYFTIFYTSIMYPAKIAKDIKSELTHYLLMEKTDTKKGE